MMKMTTQPEASLTNDYRKVRSLSVQVKKTIGRSSMLSLATGTLVVLLVGCVAQAAGATTVREFGVAYLSSTLYKRSERRAKFCKNKQGKVS
jgi:hypothetical protein